MRANQPQQRDGAEKNVPRAARAGFVAAAPAATRSLFAGAARGQA
jgi:hypothetical protein